MWQLKKHDGVRWNIVSSHSTALACNIEAIERGYVYLRKGKRYVQPDVLIVELESET